MLTLRTSIIALLFCVLVAQAETFPSGSKDSQVWDYGKLLSKSEENQIQSSCHSFEDKHGSRVWVVTVNSLSDFGVEPANITDYAKQFLNDRLSKFGGNDESILVLLSKKDRKCRIQLGRAWGNGWDRDCKTVMESNVGFFKKEKYSKGLKRIVYSLSVIATSKEESGPVPLTLANWGGWLTPYSPLPSVAILPALSFSTLILLVGIVSRSPKTKGMAGFGLVTGAVVLLGGWVVDFFTSSETHGGYKLAALVVIIGAAKLFGMTSDQSRRSSTGSSSSSSGSSSGGGGGATGSW